MLPKFWNETKVTGRIFLFIRFAHWRGYPIFSSVNQKQFNCLRNCAGSKENYWKFWDKFIFSIKFWHGISGSHWIILDRNLQIINLWCLSKFLRTFFIQMSSFLSFYLVIFLINFNIGQCIFITLKSYIGQLGLSWFASQKK